MSKRIAGTLFLAAVLCSVVVVRARAQHTASLNALTKGEGAVVAGPDQYKITAVLVLLKADGTARITLYSEIQMFAEGRWSTTKDPMVISFKIGKGMVNDGPNFKGQLVLSEDGKSIASLTAEGTGVSGGTYKIKFVGDKKTRDAPSASGPIARIARAAFGPGSSDIPQ